GTFKMSAPVIRPAVYVFSTSSGLTASILKYAPSICVKEITPGPVTPNILKELQKADILVTEPGLIHSAIQDLPNLKWMHSVWAGNDKMFQNLDSKKPIPSYKFTRFAGCFGSHMAEYVIGHILARERMIIDTWQDKQEKFWNKSVRQTYRILPELTLGILGVGDIGQEVAKVCKRFGMKIWGLVKQDIPNRSKDIDEYRQIPELPELLENCDYIVNILPSTPSTKGLLSSETLKHCSKKKSVLINVGRGDIVDEAGIINALDNGWLSGAVLDVFDEEPLPKTSALWDHPAVHITPHVSAVTFGWQAAELFCENYEKFMKGEELPYPVSWEKGY
ncbi:unnamed protein product, partial [Owenia fusiformis]